MLGIGDRLCEELFDPALSRDERFPGGVERVDGVLQRRISEPGREERRQEKEDRDAEGSASDDLGRVAVSGVFDVPRLRSSYGAIT